MEVLKKQIVIFNEKNLSSDSMIKESQLQIDLLTEQLEKENQAYLHTFEHQKQKHSQQISSYHQKLESLNKDLENSLIRAESMESYLQKVFLLHLL